VKQNKVRALGAVLVVLSPLSHASISPLFSGLYVGAIGGYGSTTWDGLVPSTQNKKLALNISTPIQVSEGGGVAGALVGYEFTPYFALEVNYLKYSNARVVFDEFSLFSFNHEGETEFISSTESYSLMAKIMLIIPKTQFKVFSSAGIADVHRDDIVLNDWRVSPTFGFGLIHPLTEHLMGELSGNYTAGFGESQLSPAESYYPFLYSVTARLAYRF
jgi:hypothetical protein